MLLINNKYVPSHWKYNIFDSKTDNTKAMIIAM